MGLIERVMVVLFGNERNIVKETAEIFRENAEAASVREGEIQQRALSQLVAEFQTPQTGWFDRVMDAANRLPRPALALGTLGLFISAMVDPVWFAARMQGIALVPEPLWWLLGAIVSFYFGARHQAKGQDFQRQIARSMAAVPQVVRNLGAIEALQRGAYTPASATTGTDAEAEREAVVPEENPALRSWQRQVDIGR